MLKNLFHKHKSQLPTRKKSSILKLESSIISKLFSDIVDEEDEEDDEEEEEEVNENNNKINNYYNEPEEDLDPLNIINEDISSLTESSSKIMN